MASDLHKWTAIGRAHHSNAIVQQRCNGTADRDLIPPILAAQCWSYTLRRHCEGRASSKYFHRTPQTLVRLHVVAHETGCLAKQFDYLPDCTT